MSLWFRTRDKDGAVHHVLIPFEPLSFVALAGIIVAIVLSFLHIFRVAVVTSPVFTSIACASILIVGFGLFALSKVSVIRAGRLVSFGPRTMSRRMRSFYYVGYVLLLIGTIAVLLFVLNAGVTE